VCRAGHTLSRDEQVGLSCAVQRGGGGRGGRVGSPVVTDSKLWSRRHRCCRCVLHFLVAIFVCGPAAVTAAIVVVIRFRGGEMVESPVLTIVSL
jgi:hypothetical protein